MNMSAIHIPRRALRAFPAWVMATTFTLGLAQFPQEASSASQPDVAASFVTDGPVLPTVQTENGVSYLSGGVGIDERQRIKDLTQAMNLQLVFAEKSGALLADVDVRVAEAGGGEVLSLPASDPLVFADLQPGTYQVAATVDGRTIQREVVVPARGRHTEVFHWG